VRFLIARGSNSQEKTTESEETTEEVDPETAPVEEDEDEERETTDNETTSLYQLRTVQFGVAKEDKEAASNAETSADETDTQFQVALVLCVLLPSQNKSDTTDGDPEQDPKEEENEEDDEDSYQTKQTMALLMYHLRKYALQLNCTLVFCDPQAAQGTESYCTLSQLALLLRSYGLGMPIWNDYAKILELPQVVALPDEEPGDDTADSQATTSSPVYGPGSYQEDLLDSVLLRNAQYPGHWDAAKESLWTILPDTSSTASKSKPTVSTTATEGAGDLLWLSELKESIDAAAGSDTATTSTTASGLSEQDLLATIGASSPDASSKKKTPKTPAAKKPSGKEAASTPGDAAAFFESLLK